MDLGEFGSALAAFGELAGKRLAYPFSWALSRLVLMAAKRTPDHEWNVHAHVSTLLPVR
jgi:hypothetical protein